jgi:hypothetical protein
MIWRRRVATDNKNCHWTTVQVTTRFASKIRPSCSCGHLQELHEQSRKATPLPLVVATPLLPFNLRLVMANRDTASTTRDLSRHIETVAQLVGVKEITEVDVFTRMSKARHKGRLLDRWGCNILLY